jgi:hypothetical protein
MASGLHDVRGMRPPALSLEGCVLVAHDQTGAAMTPVMRSSLFVAAMLLAPAALHAQEAGDKPAEKADSQATGEEPKERSTGLPSQIKWLLNVDAGWGTFGFANSLFNNPKEPGLEEDLSDQWFEGFVKPGLTATYTLDSSSVLYGKISVVGERTYGSVPEQFGHDVSSFRLEDLYIGWLLLGFSDWGTWWQGEIAGEYFLSNSNLKSHLIRLHASPLESVSGGLMFFKFSLDKPESVGSGVTSSDAAFEIDAYTDWELNSNFTISFIGAYADPGKAVQQSSGRTKNFTYGMAYVGYSF